jgi:heterodisulfide reductase subunit C
MQVSEGAVNNTASIKNLKGFDGSHPPDPKLIDSCVHCGFCLSTCQRRNFSNVPPDSKCFSQCHATLNPNRNP